MRRSSGSWCTFRGANLHLAAAARAAVTRAVRLGALLRGPCVVCGKSPTEAHHEDYAQPLVVIWLCRWHHAQRHQGDTVEKMLVERAS